MSRWEWGAVECNCNSNRYFLLDTSYAYQTHWGKSLRGSFTILYLSHVFDPAEDIHKRSTYVLMVYPTVSRTKVNIVKAFTCSERNSHLATLC